MDRSYGKVGIGTISPRSPLHVAGPHIELNSESTAASGDIDKLIFAKQHTSAGAGFYHLGEIRSWTNNGYGGGLDFYTGKHTGGGNYAATFAMRIDGDGKVGIGTTNFVTTGAKLQVKGTSAVPATNGSNFTGSIFSVEGTSTVNISMGTTGASGYYGWIQSHDAGTGTNYKLSLNPLGGNVGIGTDNPAQPLHIKSNGAVSYNGATDLDGESFLTLEGTSADGEAAMIRWANHGGMNNYFGVTQVGSNGQGDFVWTSYNGSAYAERMRLDKNGNVGIGLTPTDFANRKSLDIGLGGKIWGHTSATETGIGSNFYFDGAYKRTSANAATRHIQDGNGHTFDVAASGSADSVISSWTTAMTIDSAGKVGIGTDSPGDKLEVSRTSTSQTVGLRLTNLQAGGYGSGIMAK